MDLNKKIKKSKLFKKIKIKKINFNASDFIEKTKGKINNFYSDLKKQREKERIKTEKQKKIDKKKEIIRQRKLAQKEKLEKIREEKRQIQAQKKLVIYNEKQLRKNEEIRKK